ncbi:hypothetical protein BGZ94_007147 [Podila epigama]|nr:hypothetical protein BGZ94_007147 [Podila epigama]
MLGRNGELCQKFLRLTPQCRRRQPSAVSANHPTQPSSTPQRSLTATTSTTINPIRSRPQSCTPSIRCSSIKTTSNATLMSSRYSSWTHGVGTGRSKKFQQQQQQQQSGYDYDLALCMNRWIHRIVHGQRRSHSTLAKPMHATSVPTYTMTDISSTVQEHDLGAIPHGPLTRLVAESDHSHHSHHSHHRHSRHSRPHKDVQPSSFPPPRQAGATESQALYNLRHSMSLLPIDSFQLTPQFRTFVKHKPNAKRKMVPTQHHFQDVDQIWQQYRQCHPKDQLTRPDYTKLMRIVCHSRRNKVAAQRILELKTTMEANAMTLTRKMNEMVIQAHFVLGNPEKSIDIFQTLQEVVTGREYKRVMWTMIDGFATNGMALQGFEFLDKQLTLSMLKATRPALTSSYTSISTSTSPVPLMDLDTEWFHGLYSRLLFQHLHSQQIKTTCSVHGIDLLCTFTDWSFPPPVKDFESLLKRLDNSHDEKQRNHRGSGRLLHGLSRSIAGSLIATGQQALLMPLIVRLVRTCQLPEAERVVRLMRENQIEPELDLIRQHLLEFLYESVDEAKEEREEIIDQWEVLMLRQQQQQQQSLEKQQQQQPIDSMTTMSAYPTVSTTSKPTDTNSDRPQDDTRTHHYSSIIEHCLQNNDLRGAELAAQYMSDRGWPVSGIDFWKLNSVMVNRGSPEDYIRYLEIRYTLSQATAETGTGYGYGAKGSVGVTSGEKILPFSSSSTAVQPDLHTYRRLIYAACRRSDLHSALGLFKLVRVRHPNWTVDTSIYNAIMSTAAATGHIQVAEKTFSCMLQDGQAPDLFSFHALLNGYGTMGDLEAAILIPEKMIKMNLVPTTKTFNLVMKAYLTSKRDLATSRKLFRVMSSSNIVPPDLVTWKGIVVRATHFGKAGMKSAPQDEQRRMTSASASAHDIDPSAIHSKSTQMTSKGTVVSRPNQADDKTLLIQLKHSLALPSLDASMVWELWNAVGPKLEDSSQPVTDSVSSSAALSSSSSSSPRLPSTHVPFKRLVGSTLMLATDQDHFRFTTLNLFRTAFKARGDTKGFKQLDRILRERFPHHPMHRRPTKDQK